MIKQENNTRNLRFKSIYATTNETLGDEIQRWLHENTSNIRLIDVKCGWTCDGGADGDGVECALLIYDEES